MEKETKEKKSLGIPIGKHIHPKSVAVQVEKNRQEDIKRVKKLKVK